MTALRPVIPVEVSCRNDAAAGIGARVTVLEWADPRRATQGRAAVPLDQAGGHAVRLAGPAGRVTVRPLGDGVVVRVIQWVTVGGCSVPARVVVQLDA
jgi:hypothetical protein